MLWLRGEINSDAAASRSQLIGRHLRPMNADSEQKRQLIADQLRETPDKSNRWVGKQLGGHHATVASVRAELAATGQIIQLDRTVSGDG